ncbi:MAG: exodeoxyribonuclease VII large subunit [Acidobacteriota bacterium]
MSGWLGEPTYTVSALAEELRDLLGDVYPAVWVVGEVQRIRRSRRGHLYFELIEKGHGDDVVGKLDAVVWQRDRQRIERTLRREDMALGEGQQIRCRASLDLWPPAGRLQLVVRDIDPVFTLGGLARRRRATLAALHQAELIDRNRQLPLPATPTVFALITSYESAAYHDVVVCLRDSGYAFRVTVLDSAVQGPRAEGELVAALRAAGGMDVDCVVLARGGGAKTDLAVFDNRAVAEAVARCPHPVLTGLGHEIDDTVVDRVAHRAFATPTRVAEFLVEQVETSERRLRDLEVRLAQTATARLEDARRALARTERLPLLATQRLRLASERITSISRALDLLGRRRIGVARQRLGAVESGLERGALQRIARVRPLPRVAAERLVSGARARLRQVSTKIEGLSRLCEELAPQRLLERGFSITRNRAGQVLRDPDHVAPGESIETVLARGVIKSRVEET